MNVVYCAPVRSTHYGYALELFQAGILQAFVSGVSRFAPNGALPEIGDKLFRADLLQNAYLAALRTSMPKAMSDELAHVSKIFIDWACRRFTSKTDLFLYYNGCGLETARRVRQEGGITMVEAVNSHVLFQEQIMMEEHQRLALQWRPFHRRETGRRLLEYEEADRILVPSEFVRKSFVTQGVNEAKILKVPYPIRSVVGATGSLQHHGKNDDVFRILFVGSISLRKGVRYLIEAFGRLRHPRKELWIVGPMLNPSGLEGVVIPDGVSFLGVLKRQDLQKAYESASLFCLPSLEEGLALVLGEALGNGLPIVTTDHSGAEDLMTHDREGVITGIRDPGALCSAFERAIQDPDWFGLIRENARLRSIELQSAPQSSGIVEKLSTLIQNPSIP
jgi:glycosyltransferase involved in cell wall biosynthesis